MFDVITDFRKQRKRKLDLTLMSPDVKFLSENYIKKHLHWRNILKKRSRDIIICDFFIVRIHIEIKINPVIVAHLTKLSIVQVIVKWIIVS